MPIMINFYIHPYFWPKAEIPTDPDEDWPGFGFGIYTWTIQTYLRLLRAGVSCDLVSELPAEGILIAHRECLCAVDGLYQGKVVPSKGLYIVDISADLALYPYANLHIVQSKYQACKYEKCFYVPHWPQPSLIPRNNKRGAYFKNIVFFGNEKSLCDEFKSMLWQDKMDNMGLNFVLKNQKFNFLNPESYSIKGIWNDYSDVDAILAVRGLNLHPKYGYNHKPASKLYNAWLAGVPIIIGRDYQCKSERKSNLDYLEVDTLCETIEAIQKLKKDYALWCAVVENGKKRSEEITASKTVEKWKDLLFQVVVPEYKRWVKMSVRQQKYNMLLNKINILKHRAINRIIGG